MTWSPFSVRPEAHVFAEGDEPFLGGGGQSGGGGSSEGWDEDDYPVTSPSDEPCEPGYVLDPARGCIYQGAGSPCQNSMEVPGVYDEHGNCLTDATYGPDAQGCQGDEAFDLDLQECVCKDGFRRSNPADKWSPCVPVGPVFGGDQVDPIRPTSGSEDDQGGDSGSNLQWWLLGGVGAAAVVWFGWQALRPSPASATGGE